MQNVIRSLLVALPCALSRTRGVTVSERTHMYNTRKTFKWSFDLPTWVLLLLVLKTSQKSLSPRLTNAITRAKQLSSFVRKKSSQQKKKRNVVCFFQQKQMRVFEQHSTWKGTIGKVSLKTQQKKTLWSFSLDRDGVYSPLHGQGQPWWRIEFPYS